MNNFTKGDLVIITTDKTNNDPVAAEYLNDHAIIQDIFFDHAIVTLLNGETHKIQLNNLRRVDNDSI